jgi:ABC-type transport system involved in multi-copper enzyme maturation permease subunit
MSLTLAPYRSQQPRGRDGFAQLVRAEFTKFRTVRSWVVALGVAGVLIVAMAAVVGPHRPTGRCLGGTSVRSACTPAPTASLGALPVGPGGEPVVDTYSFVHQTMTGNGMMSARVTSLTSVTASRSVRSLTPRGAAFNATQPELVPWAKAGLIITSSATQGSSYAAVIVTPGHGARMQDDYTGDVGGLPGAVTTSSSRWLRLTRVGSAITGYDSLDGTHWTKIGTIDLPGLTRTVQVGMLVTSPSDYNVLSATLSTATFDQVRSVGDFPDGSWSNQVVGADPESYAVWPTGGNWFAHSDGRFTISGSGDIAPQIAGGTLLSLSETRSLMAGGTFGLLAIIVLAALFITAEYRRGLIRTTFIASPRRGRVLAAKAVVIGSVTFPVASVATGIAMAISRHALAADGPYVFSVSTATAVRVILGTGLLFAIAAIGILALASALRRSSGAVLIGIVAFAVPFIILTAPGSAVVEWLMRFTPVAGFAIQGTLPRFAQVAGDYSMRSGYYPLTPWVGLAVLCAWTAAALGCALWSVQHKDV